MEKNERFFFKELHCLLSSIYSKTFLLDFYWENVTHNLGKKISSNERIVVFARKVNKKVQTKVHLQPRF